MKNLQVKKRSSRGEYSTVLLINTDSNFAIAETILFKRDDTSEFIGRSVLRLSEIQGEHIAAHGKMGKQ